MQVGEANDCDDAGPVIIVSYGYFRHREHSRGGHAKQHTDHDASLDIHGGSIGGHQDHGDDCIGEIGCRVQQRDYPGGDCKSEGIDAFAVDIGVEIPPVRDWSALVEDEQIIN